MRFSKNRLFLTLVLILATALRFINLGQIPVGFNDDEAAFGYNAFSIASTGRDEWGRRLPFPVFESFGDWKLSPYLYLTVVSQRFLGVNELATRAPSALFGVFAVFATYLLAQKLFNTRVGFASAMLLAISPWHIIASRNAFESDLLVFWITISLYFFLKCKEKTRFFTLWALSLVFALYTYRSSWLFLPFFIISLIYLNRQKLKPYFRQLAKIAILVFVLLIPLLPTVSTFRGQSRFLQESFIAGISREGIINDINENRGQCQKETPTIICAAIYNKLSFFASAYINNYFGNLSYKTFFEKANPTGFQSFSQRSAFNLFELPLLIVGLIILIKQKSSSLKILIPWILLAPLGASLAGVGNYGRINLIMPAPQIIAGAGLVYLFSLTHSIRLKLIVRSLLSLLVIFSAIKLYPDIFLIESYHNSRYQRYGYKQLFNYLDSQGASYQNFYISKKIDNSHQYIQYLYFLKVDPKFFLENVQRSRQQDGWVVVERVGKYHFISSVPPADSLSPSSLLVVGNQEVEFPASPKHVIGDVRGDTIFEIYDTDQVNQSLRQAP